MRTSLSVPFVGVLAIASAAGGAADLPASDWITTGTDCKVFAAGDVNRDGFPDLLTVNGNKDLCVAPSVHGWKSAAWRVLVGGVEPDAVGIVFSETPRRVVVVFAHSVVVVPLHDDGTAGDRALIAGSEGRTFTSVSAANGVHINDDAGGHWLLTDANILVADDMTAAAQPPWAALTGPPYDPDAKELCRFGSDFGSGKGEREWAVFGTTLPHSHQVVRMAVVASGDPTDGDGDGLTDAEEATLGTDSHDPDTDDDGLLDGWEVHGLPRDRVGDLGARIALYDAHAADTAKDAQLNPLRRDVIVNVSYFEQVDRAKFGGEMPRVEAVYRALAVANPDGTTGIWVHFRELPAGVPVADQGMAWWDVGNKYFAKSERGLMHWMQVTPWGGGQSSETGDMGGCGNGWAVFAHEFGHQLSLSHTGDSAPGWCPLYPSLMNYAYSYSFDGDGAKPHLSNGEFRSEVLDERHLHEKLPFANERVAFLANHPFRFTLKDNGDGTTLIDWNHNGVFDEGEVVADINYGGSTQAGERLTHTLIGSAPSLACIAGRCFIAASSHTQTGVSVKANTVNEDWTGEIQVGSSASRVDPVLIGGPDFGVLLVRRFDCWAVAKVRPGADVAALPVVDALTVLAGFAASDVSGVRIGERVLLIARHDSNALEWRWLTMGEKPAVGPAMPLVVTSAVPVGLAIDPLDGSITVVSSATHEKHGPFTMQVSALKVDGDTVTEAPPQWTHGGRACHCTSRPVAVYPLADAHPQLVIFHTGWADGNGLWTGWRTMKIQNTSLDDGWITSQLYDEWTRSRVALGFADSPLGAFYAFRWDCGDHRDWKTNTMFVAHGGYGIDEKPMRDFNDAAKIGLWGIRHSILTMPTDAETASAP